MDTSPLSDKWFANIFSQSMTYLPILFTVFIKEQTFLFLLKSSLSMFSFVDHAFGVISKIFLLRWPWFSVLSFRVLGFTCSSILHFEFLGFFWIEGHFLQTDTQMFQYRLLKRLSFLHWIDFSPFVKNQLFTCGWIYFLISYPILLTYLLFYINAIECCFIISL